MNEPVTKELLLDALTAFKRRDDAAVNDLNYSGMGHTIEGRLGFVQGRLDDAAACICMMLRYLTENDRPPPRGD